MAQTTSLFFLKWGRSSMVTSRSPSTLTPNCLLILSSILEDDCNVASANELLYNNDEIAKAITLQYRQVV